MKWFRWVPAVLRGIGTVLGLVRRGRNWVKKNRDQLENAFWVIELAAGQAGWKGPEKLRRFIRDLESRFGRRLTEKELRDAQEWAERKARELK